MRERVPGRNLCLREGVMMPMGGRVFWAVCTGVVREEEEAFLVLGPEEEEGAGIARDFLVEGLGDLEREREESEPEEGEGERFLEFLVLVLGEAEEDEEDEEDAEGLEEEWVLEDRVGDRPRLVLLLLSSVVFIFAFFLGEERVGDSWSRDRCCLEKVSVTLEGCFFLGVSLFLFFADPGWMDRGIVCCTTQKLM